jgi:hypothetical protein
MTSTTDGRLNGVDTATLFATIDAVRAQPELADFQFRVPTRGRPRPSTCCTRSVPA